MDISLKENLIKLSNNASDNEAMVQIICKFQPLIKSLAARLKYDCSETDLVIFLIELSRGFYCDEKKKYVECQLTNYFICALRYKAIDLYRKNKKGRYQRLLKIFLTLQKWYFFKVYKNYRFVSR